MRRCVVLAVIVLLTASGCGKRGWPLPPEPRGPREPADVVARQLGDRVTVTFTAPQPRGPKPNQVPLRAELVRVSYGPGRPANLDPAAFARRAEVVGRVVLSESQIGARARIEDDGLRGAASSRSGWTLRYAVRVRDVRGRPSPLVLAEVLRPVDAPEAPAGVTARAVADGVLLQWTEREDARYHVYRTLRGNETWPETPLGTGAVDAGRYLDRTTETGQVYRYLIRETHDGERPYRESADSKTIEVLARDLFPPRAPSGLVGVQEGLAVRLFWNPNEERDLAGYRVFRRRDGGPWRPAGPDPLEGARFLDDDVAVGERLEYRVSAVDGAAPSNESPFSETIEVEIRDQLEPIEEPDR